MIVRSLPPTLPRSAAGVVTGVPNLVLSPEGLAALGTAIAAYAQTDASWWLFSLVLLAPDLLMVGYLGRHLGQGP